MVVLIAVVVFVGSLFTKDPGNTNDKDSQHTQNSENIGSGNSNSETESEIESEIESETESEIESEIESETESESESETELYVKTTTQVKLRAEANTNCATLDRVEGGTVLLVEEVLEGWYKVTYNGQTGYVSADYAEVVE